MHEPRDSREQLDVLVARGHRRQNEKGDVHRLSIEPHIVRHAPHDSGGQTHFGNQIGSPVRNGQPPAQRRAYLGLAIFNGIEDAANGILVGVADG